MIFVVLSVLEQKECKMQLREGEMREKVKGFIFFQFLIGMLQHNALNSKGLSMPRHRGRMP